VCNRVAAVYVKKEVAMVFRAFLDQKRSRPGRGRAHAGSVGLHLAALLALGWGARELTQEPPVQPLPPSSPVLPVALVAAVPRPAAGPKALTPKPAARQRRPAMARKRTAPAPRPAVEPRLEVPSAQTAAIPVDNPGAGAQEVALAGWGSAGGDGLGEGDGYLRGRRPELFARVLGNVEAGWTRRHDLPFVSHKEATTLRTDDYFPRLPAALWTDREPYVVVIELCVSEEGRVSEAALLSRASARLDPVVLAAVRGWRYRPRLEGGKPTPFCHGVVIKYERHY
jgi:hypothetical protein